MNILVINWQDIKNPYSGGAEVHMHEIFKRVAAMGHGVTILCCEFNGCEKEEMVDGIKTIRHGSRNTFNFHVKKLYRQLSAKNKYDIVIDDINKIPFYTPRYVKESLLAISHHFFGKSIFRETNFISGAYVYLSEMLVDRVYKNTPFVVVSQSTLDEFISRGFDSSNFSIVSNAIRQEQFPMKPVEKNPFPTVTYFGRMKKYKSVDHLLHAFKIVSEQMPEAQLYLMGTGNFLDTLKNLAKELGIDSRTKFFGFVSEEEKVRLLSLSHCLVNTSMKEGWGITNIEGNACGTPVISADSPGLRDSVKVGLSGMLYEYGNTAELAENILLLLNDKALQEKLNHGAAEWASRFSWQESAKMMIEVCEQTISNS